MNSFRRTAWLGACLFLFTLLWQNLHQLLHNGSHQCENYCANSYSHNLALHFDASKHCAICEYQLVLPAITAEPQVCAKPILQFFQYRHIVSSELLISPGKTQNSRAPPTAV